MKILGISAYYHDGAAALVIDGKPFLKLERLLETYLGFAIFMPRR